jgi:signal peptidase II
MSESSETSPKTTTKAAAEPEQASSSLAAPSSAKTSEAASRPSYLFLGVFASIILVLDAVSKWWAETTLSQRTLESPNIVLVEDVLTFSLAYNKGGAFGMLAGENDVWRQPFFLLVSVGAVVFIVSLYRKLVPTQHALRWGLPLVLGGALGNFADRVAKGKVVDFIDYRAGWVESMNELIAKVNSGWYVTDHWPTFNVADMAICAGIALMAIDMFFSKQAGTPQGTGKKPDAPDESSRSDSNAPVVSN